MTLVEVDAVTINGGAREATDLASRLSPSKNVLVSAVNWSDIMVIGIP